jgi:hypothetical protein
MTAHVGGREPELSGGRTSPVLATLFHTDGPRSQKPPVTACQRKG